MGDVQQIRTLAVEWRTQAADLRRYGAEPQALALEACAGELEERLESWRSEALTLEAAADETGYSYSSLQQKVAAGEIPNIGDKGKPRVRRCDLPLKTPKRVSGSTSGEPDLAGEILAEQL